MKIIASFTALVAALTLNIAPALANTFEVVNNGAHTVQSIYLSSPQSDSYGTDRLSGYMPPGDTWYYDVTGGCYSDIKIIWADGSTVTEDSWNVCVNPQLFLGY